MSGLNKKPYPAKPKLQLKLLKDQGKKSEAKALKDKYKNQKDKAKNKLKRGMAGAKK